MAGSISGTAPCTPPPGVEERNSKCGGGGGGSGKTCKGKDCQQPVCSETGSWVNLFMRSYTDEATDLSVKVPGGTIDIQREFFNEGYKYYADSWHWQHSRSLQFDFPVHNPTVSATGGSSGGGGGSSAGSVSASHPIDPTVTTADGNTVTLKPIKREGITFRPDKNAASIDLTAGQSMILRPDDGTDRIVYQGDNIWRWEDEQGNWEDYYFDITKLKGVVLDHVVPDPSDIRKGYLVAYGNRSGTLAEMIYDQAVAENAQLIGMADRNHRQVIWFEYVDGDEGHKITRIHDLDNRQIEYETSLPPHTANACYTLPQVLLHRFKDSEGHETTYTYGPIPYFTYSAATNSTGTSVAKSRHIWVL